MTPEQFTYWLQGYAELGGETPTAEQWLVIKDHLALVFAKVTPNRTPGSLPAGWPLDVSPGRSLEVRPSDLAGLNITC